MSLVETMVALMVMTVGLTGVYRIFPQSLATGRQALERTQATLLAEGRLEQIRMQGFAALAAPESPTSSPQPFTDDQQQITSPRFRWQTVVTYRTEDLLEVNLRVMWPWPHDSYHVSFTTYVSKR